MVAETLEKAAREREYPIMNINQLKYVLEVAASSSMREAATKLFVAQPALSASIHELEEDC